MTDGRLTMAMTLRKRLAKVMRRWADRLDREGAPKRTGISFEFVRGFGIEVNHEGHGCPLWYLNDADYERAYERGRA